MSHLLITGSLAYDRISVFNGKFQDHILPHKIHELSVVFSVEDMKVNYGGTAANLAYNLKLLQELPLIVGALGKDGDDYLAYLKTLEIQTDYIIKSSDLLTATATIMTDLESNQITSFYVGAMAESAELNLEKIQEEIQMAIIAPNDIKAMLKTRKYCKSKNIPFIADPGQRIPVFSPEELKEFITGSFALVINDYELELVLKQTQWTILEILENTHYLIVTHGEKGSKIYIKGEAVIFIPAYSPKKIVDPTGAGDAYRAGFMAGLKREFSIEKSAHLGAWLASKCVEKKGTQNHKITSSELQEFLTAINL